jgi:ribokinase
MEGREVAGGSRDAEVVVVGSLNMDFVVGVPHLPAPGETVVGGDVTRHLGGKGANQAVAAARLGRRTAMVGCVGDDDAGRALVEGLEADGIDVRHVRTVDGVPSGTALIAVADEGENDIVVSPGANARLGPADVSEASGILRAAAVTLVQLEIPMETVSAVAEAAAGTLILNPAPAARLSPDLLERVDVLVPNRIELGTIAGARAPTTIEEVSELVGRVSGVDRIVITLGAEGAFVVDGPQRTHVPAVPVRGVDATAAGDAFCAAIADALARGEGLIDATRWATAVAAIAVTRPGAQDSLPRASEVTPPAW